MHLNTARRSLGHGDSGPPALGLVAQDLTGSTPENSLLGAAPYHDTRTAEIKHLRVYCRAYVAGMYVFALKIVQT